MNLSNWIQIIIGSAIGSLIGTLIFALWKQKNNFKVWDENDFKRFIRRKGEMQFGLSKHELKLISPAWKVAEFRHFLTLHYYHRKKFSKIERTEWISQPRILFVSIDEINYSLLQTIIEKKGTLIVRLRKDTNELDFSGGHCI
jgi:hypothetical protein